LETNEINYKGTGNERREFIHVLDAARLSVRVLSEEYINQKILLAGPRSIELREAVEVINEILGGKIKIQYSKSSSRTHYVLSSYSFRPEVVRKLVGDYHIEFGQGILSLAEEVDDLKNAA
jgi:UDP-glucose 4-epimerase